LLHKSYKAGFCVSLDRLWIHWVEGVCSIARPRPGFECESVGFVHGRVGDMAAVGIVALSSGNRIERHTRLTGVGAAAYGRYCGYDAATHSLKPLQVPGGDVLLVTGGGDGCTGTAWQASETLGRVHCLRRGVPPGQRTSSE
jgi:hypothetical protein